MKQRAHAWAALRAYKLLDDSGQAPRLAELLSYYLSDAWDGAWLPDTLIRDMTYGHIYKMDSDPRMLGLNTIGSGFKNPYGELKSKLRGRRLCLEYASDSTELNKPYRTHPEKGGHLPNRVIALSHTLSDMLKMSDFPMAFYVKKEKPKAYMADLSAQKVKDLSLSPNFSARQIALTFFMLSHYICDAHMPLHADLRNTAIYKEKKLTTKFHSSLEAEWEKYFPEKPELTLHKYLKKSVDRAVKTLPKGSPIKIDKDKNYALSNKILKIKGDEWKETLYIARASYAVSRKWIPTTYSDADKFINGIGKKEFDHVTNCIFHDAVESTARLWYKAWERYTT